MARAVLWRLILVVQKFENQNYTAMKKYMKFLLLGLLLAIIGWGCSILGYRIGSKIDNKNTRVFQGWEIVDIKVGTKMEIYKKDGTQVKGRLSNVLKTIDTSYHTIIIEEGYNRFAQLPISTIDHVVIKTNTGKVIGLVVGTALDAISIVGFVSHIKSIDWFDFKSTETSGQSSCPIIYSHDGTNYRPDAEVFAGAIFKAAERPDWDNLDFLKEDEEGVCRLKMANEFDETQQVDFARLLAIDHPKGSRVYPAFNGKLYAITDPQNARSARDFAGTDVRARIRRTDETFWLSNPFGRDLNDPAALRDGLVLEFDRSVGTSAAALVLNVQNTPWSSEVQRSMLELPGRALPEWYDNLNQSERAREDLVGAMIREGMLKVYLWENGDWRYAGHVWEVGSALPKDIVFPLDLLGTHTNTLKVKLECPPGMWILNSVQVDYSFYNLPIRAEELTPRVATDQNGRDVLPQLAFADNQYHAMPTTSDVVSLEFDVPARQRGMERTYMFKSGGYYTIHMPPGGEPQLELMQRMLREPGAFTRFSLEALYRDVHQTLEGTQAARE